MARKKPRVVVLRCEKERKQFVLQVSCYFDNNFNFIVEIVLLGYYCNLAIGPT